LEIYWCPGPESNRHGR